MARPCFSEQHKHNTKIFRKNLKNNKQQQQEQDSIFFLKGLKRSRRDRDSRTRSFLPKIPRSGKTPCYYCWFRVTLIQLNACIILLFLPATLHLCKSIGWFRVRYLVFGFIGCMTVEYRSVVGMLKGVFVFD